jgi:hypothetical protein
MRRLISVILDDVCHATIKRSKPSVAEYIYQAKSRAKLVLLIISFRLSDNGENSEVTDFTLFLNIILDPSFALA